MTRIKICGIRDKANALAAVRAGADYIGLVFAPGQRQVTPPSAREIASAVKKISTTTRVVGVFVNAPVFQINEIADFCALDVVQLSGDESWEYCRKIANPVIKAVRIGQQSLDDLYIELSTASKLLTGHRFITLLDSQVEGKYGGTGESFNWDLAQQIARKFPVIIAGGLTPANVGQLVRDVQPWGVDVSTGVESNGLKDISKIRAFVKAVRSTQ
ncbi:MAG: phosphoribosylanthranilate isomerase [Chloroflexota bacterium]|nr:MAG: phosphoribosylanthranilate isomerase [Chloroflexota bacterium]